MEKKFNYVYLTTNILNNMKYVGSHMTNKMNDGYIGGGKYFDRAVQKYGKENFTKQILCMCDSILEARKLEEPYIKKYNTLTPNGYNISPTGGCEKGFVGAVSEETKEKQSIWQKGKTYEELYGPEKATEMKEKQNQKKLGSKRKPAGKKTKEKQSIWQKGKTYEELYGPEKATEMKEKQRNKKLGTTSKRKGKKFKDVLIKKYGEDEGIKRYEDMVKKQRDSHKGKKWSKEQHEKAKGRKVWNEGKHYKLGPYSEERIQKARLGIILSFYKRLDKNKLNIIKLLYELNSTYKEMTKQTGYHINKIKRIIREKLWDALENYVII